MKINEQQLRQIIRESLQEYLMGEEGDFQPKDITISNLYIDRVKIVGGEGNQYQFVAQISEAYCDWETNDEYGETTVIKGIVEGFVDLTQIRGAIDKKQGIQRQWVEKYFKESFGDFNITGTIQTLDNQTVTFSDENNMVIELENDTDTITVTRVVLNTTGFKDDSIEYEDEYDDTDELEEPEDFEILPTVQKLAFTLKKVGLSLEQDADKGKIRTAENQWVATYYSGNNSVMAFPDINDQALIGKIKEACANAGVRFLEQ